jgi:alkanesulfonate monooxygenase SsuD/methylene tetrahydromethanopterin reductase-like flavin-dependent oxidoreductase (luciferase family)
MMPYYPARDGHPSMFDLYDDASAATAEPIHSTTTRTATCKPEDLTENSALLGEPSRIAETLKHVEAAGFEEVILYFNVGLKPDTQVKDEMARFVADVAPFSDGKHKSRSAA